MSLRFFAATCAVILAMGSVRAQEVESNPEAQAPGQPGDATKLPAITVTATQSGNYSVQEVRGATKTDTPIIETPVSVQTVSSEVMEDQATTTIKDALENVSGVRPQPSLGGTSGYLIRGFRNSDIYRNGLLTRGGGHRKFRCRQPRQH